MENRRPMSSDVRTAANYAHNYLGTRPKLQPTHMVRVGGGYKSEWEEGSGTAARRLVLPDVINLCDDDGESTAKLTILFDLRENRKQEQHSSCFLA